MYFKIKLWSNICYIDEITKNPVTLFLFTFNYLIQINIFNYKRRYMPQNFIKRNRMQRS